MACTSTRSSLAYARHRRSNCRARAPLQSRGLKPCFRLHISDCSPSALADSYYAIQGREIVIRRLKTKEPRSEMQQQVESFVKSVLGQKPPSIEEMVMAVLKQGPALNAFLSHLRGSKEIEDDLSSLFCSKLVAAVYKHVGLIGPDRTLGDFLPKHFSAQFDGYVDLQGGAKLGPEITISFDAVQAEVDEVRPVLSISPPPPLPALPALPAPASRPTPSTPRPRCRSKCASQSASASSPRRCFRS